MNPDVKYWDQTARQWETDPANRLWRRHSDAVNARLLSGWLAGCHAKCLLKTDLFDEAFGDGLFGMLGTRAENLVGMDVSPQVLLAARRHFPQVVHVAADVRTLPFADGSFDRIVSLSTVDHFLSHDEIVASVREMARVLRAGGELLITLDNPGNPMVWLRNVVLFPWLHRVGIVPYFVGKTCGQRRLRRIVESAGLRVLDAQSVLHCPRVLAVAIARRLWRADERTQARFLGCMMKFESLGRWPWRFVSGHFVALRAVKA
ncbi:MAG: class I SAM-dependent methyltransferase [Tepidisphaeraceae bacterium]